MSMMSWTRYWATRTEDERARMRAFGYRFRGIVAGIDDDGSILLESAMRELPLWQELEIEVLRAHTDWLSRTKAKFERNGWPWTTGELERRSRLWEVE